MLHLPATDPVPAPLTSGTRSPPGDSKVFLLDRWIRSSPVLVFWIPLLLFLLACAFVRPLDHDESQYVAATALAWTLHPYRDFAYLQTPLQPLLLSPLYALFPGHLLTASRLANAIAGFATLLIVYRAQLELAVARRTALLVTALLACCEPFLFAAAVARNDMLAAAFFAAGLLLLVRRGEPSVPRAQSFAAGAAFAAAAATKLSYALPLAMLALVVLLDRRRARTQLGWMGTFLGASVASIPVVILASAAPAAFLFEVIRFPIDGPVQWYRLVGEAWKLGGWRVVDFAYFLALGPALLVLAIRAARLWPDAARLPDRRPLAYLDLMLLAGVAAGLLPNPVWRQYMLPILPPLFIRAGVMFDHARPSKLVSAALAVTAMIGLIPTGVAFGTAAARASIPLMQVERQARCIGAALRRSGVHGAAGGLSPHLYADAGFPIDARFAAGPFLFRTRDMITRRQASELHVVTGEDLSAASLSDAPQLLVSGGEGRLFARGPDLDAMIERYARFHGYRQLSLGNPLRIFVRDPSVGAGAVPSGSCTGALAD